MAYEAPFALCATSNVPFGKTIYIKSCGVCLDLTGWTGAMQLRDAPGGELRLALSTGAPTANGSGLTVFSSPVLDCLGNQTFDYFGNPAVLSGLIVLISQEDMQELPVSPMYGDSTNPSVFAYDLILTDASEVSPPFPRRWLFGSFAVSQGVTV